MDRVARIREVSRLNVPMGLTLVGLAVVFTYAVMEVYLSFADTSGLSDDTLDIIIQVEELWLVPFLATAGAFTTWLYMAHRNLETSLGRKDINFSHGSAIWWWFVPFANLVMPFRVVFETVRGSVAPPNSDSSWRNTRLPPVVGWWTAFFLAGTMGTRAAAAAIDTAIRQQDFQALDTAITGSGIAWTVMGIAAVLCAVTVYLITNAQLSVASRTKDDALKETSSRISSLRRPPHPSQRRNQERRQSASLSTGRRVADLSPGDIFADANGQHLTVTSRERYNGEYRISVATPTGARGIRIWPDSQGDQTVEVVHGPNSLGLGP